MYDMRDLMYTVHSMVEYAMRIPVLCGYSHMHRLGVLLSSPEASDFVMAAGCDNHQPLPSIAPQQHSKVLMSAEYTIIISWILW